MKTSNPFGETTINIPATEAIPTTREKVTKQQAHVDKMMGELVEPRGVFARRAHQWSEWALWKKFALGALLIAPTLVAGLIAQIIILIIISAVTLGLFSFVAWLFNNHVEGGQHMIKSLKDGVGELSQFLGETIMLLDDIEAKLDAQNTRLNQTATKLEHTEEKLDEHAQSFGEHASTIGQQAAALTAGNVQLATHTTTLGELTEIQVRTKNTLKAFLDNHTQYMNRWETHDAGLKENLDKSQTNLSQTAELLTRVHATNKSLMEERVKQVNVPEIQKQCAAQLAEAKAIFEAFKECGNLGEHVKEIAALREKLATTEARFSGLQERLAKTVDKQGNLVERQEQHFNALQRTGSFAANPEYSVWGNASTTDTHQKPVSARKLAFETSPSPTPHV